MGEQHTHSATDEAKAERQFFLLKALEHTDQVSDAIDMAERMRTYVNQGTEQPSEGLSAATVSQSAQRMMAVVFPVTGALV